MNNVIQIAQQLIDNDHFKMLLKDTVQHMVNAVHAKKNQSSDQYSQVSTVIDDISDTLKSLMEVSLSKQIIQIQQLLSKKYEQILSESIVQMEMTLNTKLQQLRQELIEQVKDEIKKQRELSVNKITKKHTLAQQRRVLGQSLLLNCSNIADNRKQIKTGAGTKFLDESSMEISMGNVLDGLNNAKSSHNIEISGINVLQISEMNKKISKYEQSQKQITHKINNVICKRVDINEDDLKRLTQKIVEMKLKTDEKIQQSFQGIWNVISNIQNKILNLTNLIIVEQAHQQQKEICFS